MTDPAQNSATAAQAPSEQDVETLTSAMQKVKGFADLEAETRKQWPWQRRRRAHESHPLVKAVSALLSTCILGPALTKRPRWWRRTTKLSPHMIPVLAQRRRTLQRDGSASPELLALIFECEIVLNIVARPPRDHPPAETSDQFFGEAFPRWLCALEQWIETGGDIGDLKNKAAEAYGAYNKLSPCWWRDPKRPCEARTTTTPSGSTAGTSLRISTSVGLIERELGEARSLLQRLQNIMSGIQAATLTLLLVTAAVVDSTGNWRYWMIPVPVLIFLTVRFLQASFRERRVIARLGYAEGLLHSYAMFLRERGVAADRAAKNLRTSIDTYVFGVEDLLHPVRARDMVGEFLRWWRWLLLAAVFAGGIAVVWARTS